MQILETIRCLYSRQTDLGFVEAIIFYAGIDGSIYWILFS